VIAMPIGPDADIEDAERVIRRHQNVTAVPGRADAVVAIQLDVRHMLEGPGVQHSDAARVAVHEAWFGGAKFRGFCGLAFREVPAGPSAASLPGLPAQPERRRAAPQAATNRTVCGLVNG
jgi:hypothetical protein